MGNARKFVVKLLTKLDDNSSYSNILLDNALEKSQLDQREKKFASALFYGVLEREITLDEIIISYSKKTSSKLSLEVRNILRTAIYQLLYMNSVPESAAVDEAVKLAKKNRNPAVSGYVNGLLRAFIRDGKKLPQKSGRLEKLSLEYSCPLPLVEKWDREYGEEICMEMLKSSIGQAPTSLRINSVFYPFESTLDMLLADGVTFEKNSFLEDSVNVCFSGGVEHTEAYRKGRFHVQDISSQLCCAALAPQSGEIILDLCSAPGGKAFTIAEIMKNKGEVLAFDLHSNRVKLIDFGAKRLGLTCVKAAVNNAKEFNQQMPMADRVLCDVPCSGLGVIRRKPEIKYKNLSDFDRLPEIQYEILKTSAKYVKVGGTLVYSTCTVSKAENDCNADRFIKENPDFVPAPLGEAFGEDKDKTRLTITPSKYNSDGFFIAKFIRQR